jgi:hypothetical protein
MAFAVPILPNSEVLTRCILCRAERSQADANSARATPSLKARREL